MSKKIKVNYEPLPTEIFSTMGCRTSNGYDINSQESIKKNIGALIKGKPLYDNVFSGAQKDSRGNLCPVTLILPTIAMEAGRDVEKFMLLLEKKIYEAKDMLLERYEYMCKQSPSAAPFMYSNMTMGGYIPEEGIKSALRHGTIVIGQLGLAETLYLLVGCDHTQSLGMELAKRIEGLYLKLCNQFKAELKLNVGVYFSPAENLCSTAMKKFKAKYGEIKNVSDHDWFTNSIHIPVWHDITPFEKIDLESQLTSYSNAGCITYVEIESKSTDNIKAMEELVNYAMDKDIPYFALNFPIDTCLSCGYQGEIKDKCPKCGGKDIQHLGRITGYLSTDVSNFNFGKQKEFENRVRHIGKVDC